LSICWPSAVPYIRFEKGPFRFVVVSCSACRASPVSTGVESEPKPNVSRTAEALEEIELVLPVAWAMETMSGEEYEAEDALGAARD